MTFFEKLLKVNLTKIFSIWSFLNQIYGHRAAAVDTPQLLLSYLN